MAWDTHRIWRDPEDNGIRGLGGDDLRLICSPDLVKFLIGPLKREYHLSKPLIASLSDPLNAALSDLHSGRGHMNAKPVDWSNLIDEDIFNVLVQYAYTGGYDIRNIWPTNDLDNFPEYREAMSKDQDVYWIYKSSPLMQSPSYAYECLPHAQIWAFAMFYDIQSLARIAVDQLRATLVDKTKHVAHCADMEEDRFRAILDVIGYIYYHGRRFWGTKIKAEAPLSGMRWTVAWFARKYLCDSGDSSRLAERRVYPSSFVLRRENFKAWTNLLEKEPMIAVDMVCQDPKDEPSRTVEEPRWSLAGVSTVA